MNRAAIIAAALALLSLPVEAAPVQRARYLMGTVCAIAAPEGSRAAANTDAAFGEAARVEAMLSTWRNDTELARVNRGDAAAASSELRALLAVTLHWAARTDGAFNPLVGPMIDLWRTREDGAIPSRQQLDLAVKRAALTNVVVEADAVSLRNGATLEEGAFGKGYALDRMLATLGPGDVMIDFGGQIAVRGAFMVSIADPRHRDRPVASLRLVDGSIATSSGSEQTFTVKGRTFSHLIDPRTGEALPPRGSASVIASDALTADILSTALYVMGPEEGFVWAGRNGVAAVFIDSNNNIRRTAEAVRLAPGFEVLDRKFVLKD